MSKFSRHLNHKISFGKTMVIFLNYVIGMRTIDLIIRKCVTFFFTFVLLAMSFAIVYGLSTVQVNNQENRYISFLISLTIVVFNFIISGNFTFYYFSCLSYFHRFRTQLHPHRLSIFLCSQSYFCPINKYHFDTYFG